MKANVGGMDRIARIFAGGVLIVLALAGTIGIWGYIVGAIVLATGIFRFCGAYTLFGISTCPIEKTPESGKT